jgi:MoaA/NifB/PqqE/SkfB family radical SAM enzyme
MIRNFMEVKKIINKGLDIIGIYDGEYAYKGPDCVQIDLTNNCNNNCIACWCNSPLLGDKAISPSVKKQSLDYGVVIKLIDKLSVMGTRELFFSGGGEPFMHPGLIDILVYAKKKGFICHLNTNFTLVNENVISRLKEMALDYLVISLWAATAKTYALTHPNKGESDFSRMEYLLRLMCRDKNSFPKVRLYNVISNLNYMEFTQMVDFALDCHCDFVEFTVVDTVPGKTDGLLLDKQQTSSLLDMCERAEKQKRYYVDGGRFIISNFDQFKRRVIAGYEADAEYDKGILAGMPCYVGWLFARVLADGNINSCLKSHRMPIGNIYEEDFDIIWNGPKQRKFRRATISFGKKSGLFSMIGNDPAKKIGCYKSCDDLGRNMFMHERIGRLTFFQKNLLKTASGIKRIKRKLCAWERPKE